MLLAAAKVQRLSSRRENSKGKKQVNMLDKKSGFSEHIQRHVTGFIDTKMYEGVTSHRGIQGRCFPPCSSPIPKTRQGELQTGQRHHWPALLQISSSME